MAMTPILGKKESQFLIIKNFVESIVSQFSNTIFLSEEHINKTDKLKKYRQYEDGDEVKAELASMLNDFTNKYKSNDYIVNVDFHASQKPGLSNYIEIKFNIPFGSKPWLAHLKIRISDHPKHNDRKIDEYIYLEGKSVEDIEKELDKIINKRIRRLEREFNIPEAQNESLRKENIVMKLKINENVTTIPAKSKLNAVIKKYFDGGANSYSRHPWTISHGGYDLEAEIYLDRTPVCDIIYTPYYYEIRNINGELDISSIVKDVLDSINIEAKVVR